MKLILHHLLKDIRALRWLLLLWALVLLVKIIVNMLVLQTDYDLAESADKVRAFPILMWVGGVTWMVLLVRLIHSEPVTGSSSFWLTRPVPLHVYISSKLIFILLFLFLPSLVPSLIDMVQLQTNPDFIKQSLLADLFLQTMGALCVIWLATYTRTLVQFWGITGLLILALIVFSVFSAPATLHAKMGPRDGELMVTRMSLFALIFFFGLFVSLIIQHLNRRSRAGLSVGVTTTVIAVAAGLWWPSVISPRMISAPLSLLFHGTATPFKETHVDFSLDWQKNVTWREDDPMVALAPLRPVVIDGKTVPAIGTIKAQFQPKNGEMEVLSPLGNAKSWGDENQFDTVKYIQKDLPGITVNPGHGPQPFQGPFELFTMDSVVGEKLKNETGTLTLTISGQMESLVRKAVIPIHGAATAQLREELIRIHSDHQTTSGILGFGPRAQEDKPVLVVWDISYSRTPSFPMPIIVYLLVDPETHTGTLLQRDNGNAYSFSNGLSSRLNSKENLVLTGKEPLDRMVLYIYEVTRSEYFNSTLTAEEFTMKPR